MSVTCDLKGFASSDTATNARAEADLVDVQFETRMLGVAGVAAGSDASVPRSDIE